MKKTLAWLLTLCMILSMIPMSVFATDDGGASIIADSSSNEGSADDSTAESADLTISTAEELKAFAAAVTAGDTFKGKTVKLAADIDLYAVDADGERVTFTPIGDKVVFEGTFDGQNHTISNMYQNGWDLGYEWGKYGSVGLFSEIQDATIKNLTLEGAESLVEGGDVGGITGSATGTCTFENITIKNSTFATYNNGCGSIIAWSGAGNYTFKNITIESDVTLAGLWGSFDSSIGGIVGQGEPGATYNFENVDIACRIDAYNDCTASYDYYLYRMCGMIIGRLEKTTTIDGTNYPDMSQYNITCTDVTVRYGDWMNYHYCEPTPSNMNNGRGMRVEPGYAYDGLPADYDHSGCTINHNTLIPFDQLFGGAQYGVKGLPTYEGVTVIYPADEVTYVAQIGETKYETLQAAIDACTTPGNYTIQLLNKYAEPLDEDVTIKQIEGVNITIDGTLVSSDGVTHKRKFSGTITIHGNSRYNGEETLTIKNIEFTTSEADHCFIDSNSTDPVERYAHNVKVDNCTFTATGDAENTAVAVRIRQGYNITITQKYSGGASITTTDMHSLFQGYGCTGVTIEKVTIGSSYHTGKNGISLGTSKDVTIENVTIYATGYGIRADGNADEYTADMTIENVKINADLPVVIRNVTASYDLTLNGTNTLNAKNTEGYQIIFTNDDDGTYVNPTGAFELTGADDFKVFPTKVYVAQIVETGVKYGSLQEALNACTNGETVQLLVDITYTEDDVVSAHGGGTGFGKYDAYNPAIIYTGGTKGATDAQNQPSNVNAVLDLNGHTITNNADAYLFLIMDNTKLTFKDSVGTGSITGTTETPVIWAVGTETRVTIESGKYTTASDEGLLWSTHGADMVITGGEFSTTADDASLLIVRNEKDHNNPNYFVAGKATITVKGGTYYGFNPEKMMDDSTNPFTEFNACAEGYYAIDNGDGSWTVSDDYVAWIKAELLAGRDVTLEKDIVVDGHYIDSIPAATNSYGKYPNYGIFNVYGDTVTFDLNGHTITYNGHENFEWNGKTYNSCTVAHGLFMANDGGNLTIVDNVGGGKVDVHGVASGVYSCSPDSVITVEGGTWTNDGCATCGGTNLFLYASHGGELYITGGTFEQNADPSNLIVEQGGEYKNAVIDFSKTKIEVSGGHFVGMNPEEAKYFYTDASNVTTYDQTTNVVADGDYALKCTEHDNCWIIGEAVAMNVNTGKGYGDVSDALDAAKADETVKLLKDCEESMVVITKGVTLDLNGNTLTADYLVAFNGNDVVDNGETKGLLKINQNNISLPEDNAQMPVWNEDGYVFSDFKFAIEAKKTDEDTAYLSFLPAPDLNIVDLLKDGASDNSISVVARVSWKDSEGRIQYLDIEFTDDLIKEVANSNKGTQFEYGTKYALTVTGIKDLTDVTYQALIISDMGVIDSSKTVVAK